MKVAMKIVYLVINIDSDQNEDKVVTVNVKVAQQQPEFWCVFFFRSTMFVWIR